MAWSISTNSSGASWCSISRAAGPALATAALAAAATLSCLASPPGTDPASDAFGPARVEFDAARSPVALMPSRSVTPRVPARVNGQPVELGIDTGAGLAVITESVAGRVGARQRSGGPAVRDSSGRNVEARMATIDLDVAGARFTSLPVIVLPDERLRASVLGITLFAFDGLLGWHPLAATRARIDFAARTLSLDPPAATCPAATLSTRGLKPLVKARVEEREVTAFLDTGAKASWALAGRPAWSGGLATSPAASLVAGASGARVVTGEEATDVRVRLGGADATLARLPFRPGAADAPHDFTAGMDLFAGRVLLLDAGCGEFALSQ